MDPPPRQFLFTLLPPQSVMEMHRSPYSLMYKGEYINGQIRLSFTMEEWELDELLKDKGQITLYFG